MNTKEVLEEIDDYIDVKVHTKGKVEVKVKNLREKKDSIISIFFKGDLKQEKMNKMKEICIYLSNNNIDNFSRVKMSEDSIRIRLNRNQELTII